MTTPISFVAPIRIESEMNLHEHWKKRNRRFKDQAMILRASWPKPRYRNYGDEDAPLTITLTRVGSKRLDADNLASGMKAVQDEIARTIGRNDGDPLITWVYEQERGKPKEYAVRVSIARTDG